MNLKILHTCIIHELHMIDIRQMDCDLINSGKVNYFNLEDFIKIVFEYNLYDLKDSGRVNRTLKHFEFLNFSFLR